MNHTPSTSDVLFHDSPLVTSPRDTPAIDAHLSNPAVPVSAVFDARALDIVWIETAATSASDLGPADAALLDALPLDVPSLDTPPVGTAPVRAAPPSPRVEFTQAELKLLVDELLLDADTSLEDLRQQSVLGQFRTDRLYRVWFVAATYGLV